MYRILLSSRIELFLSLNFSRLFYQLSKSLSLSSSPLSLFLSLFLSPFIIFLTLINLVDVFSFWFPSHIYPQKVLDSDFDSILLPLRKQNIDPSHAPSHTHTHTLYSYTNCRHHFLTLISDRHRWSLGFSMRYALSRSLYVYVCVCVSLI